MLAPVFSSGERRRFLPHFAAAAADLANRLNRSSQFLNLALAFQKRRRLEAVLRAALFSPGHSEQRGRITAMVRRYFSMTGPSQYPRWLCANRRIFCVCHQRPAPLSGRPGPGYTIRLPSMPRSRRTSPTSAAHGDLLDLLLAARTSESGEALSNVEVRDQWPGSMLTPGSGNHRAAPFGTTYLLTLDAAQQDRLRDELAAFPPERVSKLDDLLNWPRLRQTLLEALRSSIRRGIYCA